jgi:hypothetical protein
MNRTIILCVVFVGLMSISLFAFWSMPFMRKVPFPVPDCATWVRYRSAYTPGPGGEEWTKFVVPVEVAEGSGEDILRSNQRGVAITRTIINEDRAVKRMGGPWWFDPHTIKLGVMLCPAENQPFSPTVWVDLERGTVYEHMSD